MSSKLLPLQEVAPSHPIRLDAGLHHRVWLLNLDQVASGTGEILNKEYIQAPSAGTSTHGFDDRHVLYSKLRPYLNKVVLPDEPGLCTTELVPLAPNPEVLDRAYLAHYLRSKAFVDWVSNQTAGAKMPRVNMSTFWDHRIPAPELTEQKRIAAILDKVDGIRRQRREALALNDDFLNAAFLEMFGDLESNSLGWQTIELGELITEGPTNGLYVPATQYGHGTPILRIDGFYEGKILPDYTFKRVNIDQAQIDRFRIRDNSIIINRVNSKEYVGKAALVEQLAETTVFESNMMNFMIDTERAELAFVVHQLGQPYVRRQIATARKDAVNQSSINQQDVKGLQLRLPPRSLQQRFTAIHNKIDELVAARLSDLESTDKLIATLQDRFFQP